MNCLMGLNDSLDRSGPPRRNPGEKKEKKNLAFPKDNTPNHGEGIDKTSSGRVKVEVIQIGDMPVIKDISEMSPKRAKNEQNIMLDNMLYILVTKSLICNFNLLLIVSI